jgi:hypothetical protein
MAVCTVHNDMIMKSNYHWLENSKFSAEFSAKKSCLFSVNFLLETRWKTQNIFTTFQFKVTNSKESWKGVKKLSKLVENVWKTNNIFHCRLCWKIGSATQYMIIKDCWSLLGPDHELRWNEFQTFAASLQAFSEFLKHMKKKPVSSPENLHNGSPWFDLLLNM